MSLLLIPLIQTFLIHHVSCVEELGFVFSSVSALVPTPSETARAQLSHVAPGSTIFSNRSASAAFYFRGLKHQEVAASRKSLTCQV